MEDINYKAAAFVFYRNIFVRSLNKQFLQVYLQYEYKYNQWSHFGGKREPFETNSFQTALRELQEENQCSPALINFLKLRSQTFTKKYFPNSKMVVYYVEGVHDFNEANWFVVDTLPSNIRPHIIQQFESLEDQFKNLRF